MCVRMCVLVCHGCHAVGTVQPWSAELEWRAVAVEKPLLLRQRSDGFEKGLKVGAGPRL